MLLVEKTAETLLKKFTRCNFRHRSETHALFGQIGFKGFFVLIVQNKCTRFQGAQNGRFESAQVKPPDVLSDLGLHEKPT